MILWESFSWFHSSHPFTTTHPLSLLQFPITSHTKNMVLSKKAPGSTHVQRKKTCSKSKHQREVSDKKMIVGHKTNTSNKYHVLVCGDCDVADIYQHMEYSIPVGTCLLYTSPSPRDATLSRMPSSA